MAADDLPQLLREIATVAGLPAALAVAAAKGGQRVSIPRHPGPGHWLTEAVGPAAAARIADHFATGMASGIKEVDVPMGSTGSLARQRRERRRKLDELLSDNASSNEIARTLGITRRSAIRARNRAREDEGQGSLL